MKAYVSIFPSGRAVATLSNRQIVLAKSEDEMLTKLVHHSGVKELAAKECIWDARMFKPAEEHHASDGTHTFTDRGKLITFDRVDVSDEDIRSALVHAQHKFGNQLTLTGDDPLCAARMAKLADDMGITILNPELKQVIADHRASRMPQTKGLQ